MHLCAWAGTCFVVSPMVFDLMSDLNPPETVSLKPPNFRSARTILALMLREMSTTYGRSAGGYIWAVLQPVGMILVLSLAFSLVVRKPSLGTNFILFYATGYLPYTFYGALATKTAAALIYSRPLLTYPAVTWIDAVLARFLLTVVTSATVFCIVISSILLLAETRTILDLPAVLLGAGICISIGVGVGLCNAVLTGLFPVWAQIWAIITRPLFLASGVIFIYEDVPAMAQSILWWNPLIHGTGLTRTGFYPTYRADYVSLVYCYGLAIVMIALGLIFMRATYKTLLER